MIRKLSQTSLSSSNSDIIEDKTITSVNSSISNDVKRVTFKDDENLIHGVLAGDEAWHIDPTIRNEQVIDMYVAACCEHGRKPLYVVIDQLSKVTIPLPAHVFRSFSFKGIQLVSADIDALEHVFKFCFCNHLSFENTNLDNDSVCILLDLIDFYSPCTELCLARNKKIDSDGIRTIAKFLSQFPCLNWLDLREIRILYTDARILGKALPSQSSSVTKFSIFRKNKNEVSSFPLDEINADVLDFSAKRLKKKNPHIFKELQTLKFSNPQNTQEVKNYLLKSLADLPRLCLRGLHLGETKISGPSISEIGTGIRMSGSIIDLRLPSNQLTSVDMDYLVPLLRYYSKLEVLDLSNNEIQDTGCEILAKALATPSYESKYVCVLPKLSDDAQKPKIVGNLRRLYLSNNGITSIGANALSSAMSVCQNITHLYLSSNPNFGSNGVLSLKHGLQTLRGLRYLGLARCNIANQGAIALAEIIGDTPRSLHSIDLTKNNILEAGMLAILRSLPLCPSLVKLIGLQNEEDGITLAENLQKSDEPTFHQELIAMIHDQLSANLNAELLKPSFNSSHNIAREEVGFKTNQSSTFRGYYRFNLVGPDPRHLSGDTSEEDNDEDVKNMR